MKLKIIILLLFSVFVISGSVVSAAEVQSVDMIDSGGEVHLLDDNATVIDTYSSHGDDVSFDSNIQAHVDSSKDLLGLYVFRTNINLASFDTLQEEINNAPAGSVLDLEKDYIGSYGSRVWLVKDLTIDGHGHSLQCDNKSGSAFYSSQGNIVLKNLRIYNGYNDHTDKGGGIYIEGSAKFYLENCTFENNFADDYGGAIYNGNNNDLNLVNCVFRNNKADDDDGGAIYSKGRVNVENCIFVGNCACVDGGAIFCKNDVNIISSSFVGNRAAGARSSQCYGGAVRSLNSVSVDNSTFIVNFAADYGGAVYAKNVNVVKNCGESFFISNSVGDNQGGAIYAVDVVVIINAHLVGNFADESGGAIHCPNNVYCYSCLFKSNYVKSTPMHSNLGGAICADRAYIDNSTFVENWLDENRRQADGGAVYAEHGIVINNNQDTCNPSYSFFIGNNACWGGALYSKGDIVCKNTIFKLNTANTGAAVYGDGSNVNLTNSYYYSNVADGGDFFGNVQYTDLCDMKNRFKQDSMDVLSSVSLSKESVSFWVESSDDLKNLFMFIENNRPTWKSINVTLAPFSKFNLDYCDYHNYCLHLGNTNLFIKGTVGNVISGKDKYGFVYVMNGASLSVVNVTLSKFRHCFVNHGGIYCANSSFIDNDAYDSFTKVSGGVIENHGSACFDNCIFSGNRASAEVIKGVSAQDDAWGSILYAASKSLNIFRNCDFRGPVTKFINASSYSNTIIYQDKELGDIFKDCYFDRTAGLSVVSSKVQKDIVFNCSSVGEFKNVMYNIGCVTPNCKSIVINLAPGVYELGHDWIGSLGCVNTRSDFSFVYDPTGWSFSPSKVMSPVERYALNVGVVPVVVNGNGACVKFTGDLHDHFAFIGYGGVLSLNNMTFSNFNGVYHNYGTLNLVDCIFTDNIDGGIIKGAGCSNYLVNCIFKGNTDIVDIRDAFIRFDTCDFAGRDIVGRVYNSVVESSSDIKNHLILSEGSVFYNTGLTVVNGTIINRGASLTFDILNNDYWDSLSRDILLYEPSRLVLNVSCDCDCDLSKLNYADNLIILGNGHRVNFDFGQIIDINSPVTFVNLTFSNYNHRIFNIVKNCIFASCNFTSNTGDYLFSINRGSCTLINCSLYNNNGVNLIYNDLGILSLNNCSVFRNHYSSEYGLIYNNRGCIMAMNSVFLNAGGCDIANFNTDDCVIFNCTGCRVVNDYEKYSMAEKIAIRTAIMWGAGILSFATGFLASGAVISFLPAVGILGFLAHAGCAVVSGVVGGLIGACAGLVDDAVIGGSERDHSNRGDIILQYAIIGAGCGFSGGLLGSFCPFFEKNTKKEKVELIKDMDEENEKFGIDIDKKDNFGIQKITLDEDGTSVDVEIFSSDKAYSADFNPLKLRELVRNAYSLSMEGYSLNKIQLNLSPHQALARLIYSKNNYQIFDITNVWNLYNRVNLSSV